MTDQEIAGRAYSRMQEIRRQGKKWTTSLFDAERDMLNWIGIGEKHPGQWTDEERNLFERLSAMVVARDMFDRKMSVPSQVSREQVFQIYRENLKSLKDSTDAWNATISAFEAAIGAHIGSEAREKVVRWVREADQERRKAKREKKRAWTKERRAKFAMKPTGNKMVDWYRDRIRERVQWSLGITLNLKQAQDALMFFDKTVREPAVRFQIHQAQQDFIEHAGHAEKMLRRAMPKRYPAGPSDKLIEDMMKLHDQFVTVRSLREIQNAGMPTKSASPGSKEDIEAIVDSMGADYEREEA